MAKSIICSSCGTQGKPRTVTKGSIFIEIILWLFMLLPGLIYSIWRLSSRHDACRACGDDNLVPLTSPVGRELAQKYNGSTSAPA